MNLFPSLAKYQKTVDYRKTEDYLFFVANRHLFNGIEIYKSLLTPKDEFDVIRANIVIQALRNKKTLDEVIVYAYKKSELKTEEVPDFVKEQTAGMPYIGEGQNRIYVPIFSRAINSFYFGQYGKLMKEPYNKLINGYKSACIDLFEVYNFDLYDSLFTKLITIYRDEKVMVVYHFDFHTIYVINDQGRLDAKIALFDKYLKNPKNEHMIERIKPVVEKYLQNDKDGMCKVMLDKNLISERAMYKIKHAEYKWKRTLMRKAK